MIRRPARSFKQSHQFLVRNFFTRHRARRPTIEQDRFDLVVCFSNFAAFDHSNVVSHSRAFSTSAMVSSWPAWKSRIVTFAPALRKSSSRALVSDIGIIGSFVPAPIQTRTDDRFGCVSG